MRDGGNGVSDEVADVWPPLPKTGMSLGEVKSRR